MSKRDFECAGDHLTELTRMSLNEYETAQVWNWRAYLAITTNDWPRATVAYENMLRIESIPQALYEQTVFSLAQLYIRVEDFGRAVALVDRYLEAKKQSMPEGAPPAAHYLRAAALRELGRLDAALESVELAILASSEPQEWVYELRLAVQEGLSDREGMIETLERMDEYWPSDARTDRLEQLKSMP